MDCLIHGQEERQGKVLCGLLIIIYIHGEVISYVMSIIGNQESFRYVVMAHSEVSCCRYDKWLLPVVMCSYIYRLLDEEQEKKRRRKTRIRERCVE